jgi:hypothetical protein
MQIINHFRGEAHTLHKTLGVNVDLLFYYWFALFREIHFLQRYQISWTKYTIYLG